MSKQSFFLVCISRLYFLTVYRRTFCPWKGPQGGPPGLARRTCNCGSKETTSPSYLRDRSGHRRPRAASAASVVKSGKVNRSMLEKTLVGLNG